MRARLPRRGLDELTAADPRMAALVARVGPFRMELTSERSHLYALAHAIVHQQLSGKAAATIFARLEALFPPGTFPDARALLRISPDLLRDAGLSRGKSAALLDLAEKAGSLGLDALDALSDDDIVTRLVRVRGIGPWSAQMFLMFHLGRPDVWPSTDLGIRKGAQVLTRSRKLPTVASVERLGARFRPWRSAAAWYLWRALD